MALAVICVCAIFDRQNTSVCLGPHSVGERLLDICVLVKPINLVFLRVWGQGFEGSWVTGCMCVYVCI